MKRADCNFVAKYLLIIINYYYTIIITPPLNPKVSSIIVEDLGISDYFMAIPSFATSKPLPSRKTSEARNVKAIDINFIQLMLTASDVFTTPKSNMDDFAHKRKDTFIVIVDVYTNGAAVHD